MQTRLFFATASFFILASAVPVVAHHAFTSEFDGTKPVTLKGTVTKMEWINPHAWLHIDVKGPDGKAAHRTRCSAAAGTRTRCCREPRSRSWGSAPRMDPIEPTAGKPRSPTDRSCSWVRRELARRPMDAISRKRSRNKYQPTAR